ncbi:unnamed protein product [Spirodela intermedia]|uniref:Uncharacterized protein n=2 Tax=Spirodela intermedia TaxID=51605 RepID=A0A7I8IKY3_SPIIN|nr:unnamed protein product [Spirodela intermedia]CAA6658543.1 unnamed protein product [Spirodela intermedia]CAA7394814.1 unnamed protein product [Spirodela intermedia]
MHGIEIVSNLVYKWLYIKSKAHGK